MTERQAPSQCRVSVVIPARDAQRSLPACLKALNAQAGLIFGQDFEVIVVDDGSQDETARVAREGGARVIVQPNAGPASARNQGVRHAGGEIIAFTDADCIPAPDWLSHMLTPFKDPRVVGVKGVYRTHEHGLTPRFVQIEYASKYERMQTLDQIDFIDTYSAAYRRSTFVENGGFDEVFPAPSVEDQEFSFRLARKGYRLVFQPRAAVYHRHDRNPAEYWQRKFGIGYWKAIMINWLPEKTLSDSHTLPSQRWQILLTGAVLAALAAGMVWRPAMLGAVGLVVLYLLTTLPFLAFIARRDPPVLAVALPLLILRSLALGFGMLAGLAAAPRSVRRVRKGLSLVERLTKRAIDLAGASLGLLITAPLTPLLAAWIRIDSPGPVIFAQWRAGENGRPFWIYKLRTMFWDAESPPENGSAGRKIPNDARVTRAGRFLRRWSLDEIPQFWNVLKGEMSLVGPRPEEMAIVEHYSDSHRQRLLVKPGMTGPMQVSGRGRLAMDERLCLELDYINDYSLWKDLRILLRSLPAIFKGDGAF